MAPTRMAVRLVLASWVVCLVVPMVQAGSAPLTLPSPPGGEGWGTPAPARAAFVDLPAEYRDKVRQVVSEPTLHTHGPIEVFRGRPAFYQWLLEHPDKAVLMWRRIGARCTDITDRGGGRFGLNDGQGSDIHWDTVHRSPDFRIWYAEGVATPGPLIPPVSVRAVVILRHAASIDPLGRTLIHHQAELFMQTDSRAAALMARIVGSSAPRLAEQCVGQMELFFSGPVYYLERHPERAEALLLGVLPTETPGKSVARGP